MIGCPTSTCTLGCCTIGGESSFGGGLVQLVEFRIQMFHSSLFEASKVMICPNSEFLKCFRVCQTLDEYFLKFQGDDVGRLDARRKYSTNARAKDKVEKFEIDCILTFAT